VAWASVAVGIGVPATFADLNHCQNVLVRNMGVAPLDAPIVLKAPGHKGQSRAEEINSEFLDLRKSFAVRLLLRMNTPAYEARQFAVTVTWSAMHVIQPLGVGVSSSPSWPWPVALGVACTYAVALDRFGTSLLRLWVGTGWEPTAAAEREPETMEAPRPGVPVAGKDPAHHRHHANAASPVHRRRSSRGNKSAAVAVAQARVEARFSRRGAGYVATADACLLLATLAGGAMLLFPPSCGGDDDDDSDDGCAVAFRTVALTLHLVAGGMRPLRSVRLIEAVETVYFSGQGRANASLLVSARAMCDQVRGCGEVCDPLDAPLPFCLPQRRGVYAPFPASP
jgi:hypothetical protein